MADIEKFFETCPPELLSRRFRHFLRHVWIACGRPHGTDIQFFKAVDDYRRACFYRSATTARSNLRAAETLGLLEVAYRDPAGSCHHIWIRPRTERDKGLYRRVTTHRLPISLLLRWRNGHHHGDELAEVMPIRKPSAPVPPPPPPAPAAPLPAKPAAEIPQKAAASGRPLTPRQRKELAERIDLYQKGCTEVRYSSGECRALPQGDRDYVKPMDRIAAMLAACRSMGVGDESRGLEAHGCAMQKALEAAKEMHEGP